MNVKVDREGLVRALSMANLVCGKSSPTDATKYVRLTAEQGAIHVFATNYQQTVMDHEKCEVSEEGEVSVKCDSLYGLLTSIPGASVTLSDNGNRVILKNEAGISYKLGMLDKEASVLQPPKQNPLMEFALDDTESFSDVWTKLNKWMSKTHPSPFSRGFYFDITAKKGKDDVVKPTLLVVGTNTAQIGICDVKIGGIETEGAWNFMVPYDNMEFCKNIPGGIKATLSFDANFLNISYGTLKVMLTLMGVAFPPYKTIIPNKETTSRVEIPTKDLSSVLERLSYIQAQTTVSFARVSFVEAGVMKVSVATQTGEGEEKISIVSEKKFEGFPDSMFFSVPTMQNYCKSLKKTDGNIVLGIQNDRKPMILKPSTEEKYYLVTVIPAPDDCIAAEKKIMEMGKKETPKVKEEEAAPKGEEEPPATGTDNPPAEGEEGA